MLVLVLIYYDSKSVILFLSINAPGFWHTLVCIHVVSNQLSIAAEDESGSTHNIPIALVRPYTLCLALTLCWLHGQLTLLSFQKSQNKEDKNPRSYAYEAEFIASEMLLPSSW